MLRTNRVVPVCRSVHRRFQTGWCHSLPTATVAVMASGATTLSVLDDPLLADSVDRVAAAAGVPVLRRDTAGARSWSGASAIILDERCAQRCLREGMPRRDGVFLVGLQEPSATTWEVAIQLGAQGVFILPDQERELVQRLSEAAESRFAVVPLRGRTIAVIAGRGGAGASVFSVALARCADEALLIDLDFYGGGIDLLLGAENVPGLRWPDLRLEDGRLAWAAVRQALPGVDGVRMLSGSRAFHEIEQPALGAVLESGLRGGATVICDVPRQLTPLSAHALQTADLVAVITSCDVRGIVATASLAGVLRTVNQNIGLVVRGPAPGGLRAVDAAQAAALPLIAAMRPEPGLDQHLEAGGWRLRRRSPLVTAARTVLAAVNARVGAA